MPPLYEWVYSPDLTKVGTFEDFDPVAAKPLVAENRLRRLSEEEAAEYLASLVPEPNPDLDDPAQASRRRRNA